MNTLQTTLLCLCLASPVALAEDATQTQKAVPLDNFRIKMSFGGGNASSAPYTHIRLAAQLDAGQDKPEFKVSYLCGNITNTRSGKTTNYFPLTESDVRTLIRVGGAAQNQEAMAVEVDYENVAWTTRYESIQLDGEWKIVMKREHWLSEFDADEGERLGNRLAECMSTMAWYEKLFTAEQVPEPTEHARPPTLLDEMTMTASFGEVSLGDLGYRSDFAYGSNEQIPSNTHHQLAVHYIHQSPQKFQGPWVRDMMAKTSEAARAANQLEGYSFRARKKEMTYAITAWPDKKLAELRLHSDLGRDSFMAPTAKLDKQAAEEVQDVLRRAEEFERWFARNRHLLAAHEPKALPRRASPLQDNSPKDWR